MCPESAQGSSESSALVRIGELSRRTAVGTDTLRAWERRYGVLEPERSPGGFRLYSAEDERRIRAMRGLIDQGLSAAQAATTVLSAGKAPDAGDMAPAGEENVARLMRAIETLDEEEANRVLDRSFASLSFESVAEDLLLPVLRAVGEGWQRGEVTVGQEHFATNLLRGRLLGLARGWMTGIGPVALLACPPGEDHDLGLILFGLCLRARGWRIAFLGANTPSQAVAETADAVDAALVVVAALTPEPLRAAREELHELASRRKLALGGAGSTAGLAEELGAERLALGPVEEAARVSAAEATRT